MTQQEAIEVMDKAIFTKPVGVPDDQIRINVTKEIADLLTDYHNSLMSFNKWKQYQNSGDIFYYKGIECKVI